MTPSLAAIIRMPSTAKSRTSMIANTHTGTTPSTTSAKNAKFTSILSANGSKNAPKSVTIFSRRAHLPSTKSEIAPAINNTSATIFAQVSGANTKNINSTDNTIRAIVR